MYFRLPFYNLKRRFVRSALTILGIAVAVGSFIALVSMSRGLERAWVGSLQEKGTHLLAVSKDAVEILTTSLDEAIGAQLTQVEGVKDVAPELVDLVNIKKRRAFLVTGWPEDSFPWHSLKMVKGAIPTSEQPFGIVIGHLAAKALEKGVGDSLKVGRNTFEIVGIAEHSGVMGNNTVMLLLPTLQKILKRIDAVTAFNIRIDHPEDPQEVKATITRLNSAIDELAFYETNKIVEGNQILQLFRAITLGTSIVALLMALVIILNTLLMSITERTHEIGILSAIGWSSDRIIFMILCEGVLLTVVGSLMGCALGVGGLRWLVSIPQIQGFIQPEVTLRLIIEVSVATILLGILGSLYPACHAARLNPVDALRHE